MSEASWSSYKDMYASFMSRTNDSERFNNSVETMLKDKDTLKLDRVKTCLAIGTGAGHNEITFTKRLMPNLQSFTVVEPDPSSAAQVRHNLQHHLPSVKSIVHEMKSEDFIRNGDLSSQSYDAVLFFKVLYHLAKEDRDLLYKTVFNSTLNSEGIAIINHGYRSGQPNELYNIIKVVNPDYSQPYAKQVKHEILQTGFQLYGEYNYSYELDLRDPDEGLLGYFNRAADSIQYVSMDKLKAAIGQLYPNNPHPISTVNCVFYFFEKP